MITRRQFMLGVAGGLAGAAGLGSYAFGLEPRFRLVVTEWTLATQKWPHERPLRIVALADIHACEPWMPVSRIGRLSRRRTRSTGTS